MSLSAGAEWVLALGAASLPVLVDAAIKGSAILAMACIASVFVRRASAATRHLVWFLALASLLAMPALSWVLPGWQVLPGWVDVARPAAHDAPAPEPPPWAPATGVAEPVPIPDRPSVAGDPPAPLASVPPVPEAPPPVRAAAPSPWSATALGAWLVPVWALVAATALVPALLGAMSLWFLARSSRRVTNGPWMALLERLSAGLGLRRRVVLLASDRRSMPMAWGVRRPKLLIPAEAERWPPGCLCAVLLHELAHVKRWDCLTQLVMRIACGLYWFNPLAWVAFRCAVAEHERACDDVVLAAGGKPSEYAEYLLDVASRLPGRRLTLGVAIALARPSRLEGRLLAILDGKRSRRAVTRAGMLAAVALLVVVTTPLAVLRPAAQAEPDALRGQMYALAADAVAAARTPSEGGDRRPAAANAATARTDGVVGGVDVAGNARTLDLRGRKATDADLAKLKEADDLDVLYVSGEGITDAGLKELQGLKRLRELHLWDGNFTDAGLRELAGVGGLEVLYLRAGRITPAGLGRLGGIQHLRELHLESLDISTDAGLKELAALGGLEVLRAGGANVTDAGLKELRGLTTLRKLSLRQSRIKDEGLAALGDLQHLEALDVGCTGVGDAGLKAIARLKALRSLNLMATRITDAGLKELSRLPNLQELDLRWIKITDGGLGELKALSALRVLDLTHTNVTDAGLKELEGLKDLRELHCVGAAVTEAGVDRLRKALPDARITAGPGGGATPTLDPAANSGGPDSGPSPAAAGQAAPTPAAASGRPATELAAPDEVLKQLTTIVDLEERILAMVQEHFRAQQASAEDVARQQLKVTDAKVRLAERKAELASPPGAAPTDEIRRLLAEAVAREEGLLAQVQERHRVGIAAAVEVEKQQVRVTEARVRLARCKPEARRTGPEAASSLAPVRFQATIYEVRLKADRVARLDTEHLAATAGTGVDLEKALADLGEARVLYRVDQTVNLTEDRIHIGKREPFVTGARASRDGSAVNTIQYEDVGVMFGFSGGLTERGADVTLNIELSAFSDSATEVASGVKAVTIRKAIFGRAGPIRLGGPEVLVSADASALDADGNVIAYVCRMVFSDVRP